MHAFIRTYIRICIYVCVYVHTYAKLIYCKLPQCPVVHRATSSLLLDENLLGIFSTQFIKPLVTLSLHFRHLGRLLGIKFRLRHTRNSQKSPICGKRALCRWQKSPINVSIPAMALATTPRNHLAYMHSKRAVMYSKRAHIFSTRAHVYSKRALCA